jgi:hypothetical protein
MALSLSRVRLKTASTDFKHEGIIKCEDLCISACPIFGDNLLLSGACARKCPCSTYSIGELYRPEMIRFEAAQTADQIPYFDSNENCLPRYKAHGIQ